MDSVHDSHSPPFLPSELEREIFETAVAIYPETLAPLLLVAQRVHEWMERVKYRTVISNGDRSLCRIAPLQWAIRANLKPAGFFRERVRHLFVSVALDQAGMQEILTACSGVVSLALIDDAGPWALPELGVMQPCRLCVHLTNLFGGIESLDLSHSMFTRLTHLDLFDTVIAGLPWPAFATLPALTHLALYQIRSATLLERVLSTCTQLAVLVDMRSAPPPYVEWLSADDARFICIVVADVAYARDWFAGTQDDSDFWARADAFVAKKRRGEIRPSSRCWIEEGDGI
ncbi:hypothetical protein FB451DRAFT_681331 [Mycena latifolia]|nr:hypothetical protein FB451DRAFT_681331 [Mycena latifolia]